VHSVNKLRFIEISQQAEWARRQFQVSEHLRLVHWKHSRDRFHFDNNAIRDHQVDPVVRVEGRESIPDAGE
jgi:hypothetical protein